MPQQRGLRNWTCTSDTAGGEDRLCSRIESHVRSSGPGARIEVRVAAPFLATLKTRLPVETTVTADFAFGDTGFGTRFDDRVTVVTNAGEVQNTATFELKKVPRVVPTVTIGAQVWAQTNLRNVTGLTEAKTAADFATLTSAKTPAYMRTPTDGVLYNVYVDFATLCPADLRVPTEPELRALALHYSGADKVAMVLAMKSELGMELGGYLVDGKTTPGTEAWWAGGVVLLVASGVLDPQRGNMLHEAKVGKPPERALAGLGVSVRLIRR